MYPLYKAKFVSLFGFAGNCIELKKKFKMAFGIIRARNLSAGDISEADKHNARKYSSEQECPENIKFRGRNVTAYLSEKNENYLHKDETSLQEVLDVRLKENNVKGIRKNSNLAIEYVCTINDKKAWEAYHFDGYVSNTQKWLEDRHGKDSVIAVYKHEDESNPHAHFVVVPLEKKEVKWKNKNSQGVREETRLNTREFTGGRDKLRKLQDDYFEHLTGRYGEGKDNTLGVPLYRGTLVENQFKEYSQQTDHKIGELRNELQNINDEVIRKEKELEIALKQTQFNKKKQEFENKSKRKNQYNRKNWGNKGTRDNSTIFHTEPEKKKYRGPKM